MDKREEEAVQTDDEAVDFVFRELSAALGQDGFEVHDGTETWDGDVSATMYGILYAAGVIDDENKVATHTEITRLQSENAALREALKPFADAADKTLSEDKDQYYIYYEDCSLYITIGHLRKAREALAAGGK